MVGPSCLSCPRCSPPGMGVACAPEALSSGRQTAGTVEVLRVNLILYWSRPRTDFRLAEDPFIPNNENMPRVPRDYLFAACSFKREGVFTEKLIDHLRSNLRMPARVMPAHGHSRGQILMLSQF